MTTLGENSRRFVPQAMLLTLFGALLASSAVVEAQQRLVRSDGSVVEIEVEAEVSIRPAYVKPRRAISDPVESPQAGVVSAPDDSGARPARIAPDADSTEVSPISDQHFQPQKGATRLAGEGPFTTPEFDRLLAEEAIRATLEGASEQGARPEQGVSRVVGAGAGAGADSVASQREVDSPPSPASNRLLGRAANRYRQADGAKRDVGSEAGARVTREAKRAEQNWTEETRIVVHSRNFDDRLPEMLQSLLEDSGAQTVEQREIDFSISQDHIRFYHSKDYMNAIEVATALDGVFDSLLIRDFSFVRPSPSEGLVEIWLR